MYLSRARFWPQRARSVALGDGYAGHRLVWQFFGGEPGADRDFLFRLQPSTSLGRPNEVYILSRRKPLPVEPWSLETKPFQPDLAKGDVLRFELRASPTVKRKGKRHDVVIDRKKQLEADQLPRNKWPPKTELIHQACSDWLQGKAVKAGFTMDPARLIVSGHSSQAFWKSGSSAGSNIRRAPIQLTTCDFIGYLEVQDPSAFVGSVHGGFGPGKAFGLGLMLLRRG